MGEKFPLAVVGDEEARLGRREARVADALCVLPERTGRRTFLLARVHQIAVVGREENGHETVKELLRRAEQRFARNRRCSQ
jgi:hypothetical protein